MSAAEEEFDKLVANNSAPRETVHPEDREANGITNCEHPGTEDLTEEEVARNAQIEATMRMPVGATAFRLPPTSFDSGHATGVKGVIADARHYQTARRSRMGRAGLRTERREGWSPHTRLLSTSTSTSTSNGPRSRSGTDSAGSDDEDGSYSFSLSGEGEDEDGEAEFLEQWRETRRREMEREARRVHTRRTSPSVRVYGRMDEVDALGYLDAIEKVGRETTVVVFVYDHECEVSGAIDAAIQPLVRKHPQVHFVKIHYEEIEFDNAAVPAILAYRNQGDLVANLTGLIEMMPDDVDDFGVDGLEHVLRTHAVL